MKRIDLKERALISDDGEAILGLDDTGSHACYMIYGIVKPGETGRLVRAGKGHEEIVLAMSGGFELTGACEGTLSEGEAFHITGTASVFLENRGKSDAVYIIAGGHSEDGHHH